MKSTFNDADREELITRIQSLTETSTPKWGKMNVQQMIKHCTVWEDMILGKPKLKQAFIGRIFGKMALKKTMQDDKPIARNLPTLSILKINGPVDISAEKAKWVSMVRAHEHYVNPGFIHPFFGKMTDEQIGIMAYKHTDHHLRQFNV